MTKKKTTGSARKGSLIAFRVESREEDRHMRRRARDLGLLVHGKPNRSAFLRHLIKMDLEAHANTENPSEASEELVGGAAAPVDE